jgi:hypothetical protein
MANAIEAGFDIPFQDPLGILALGQEDEALLNRIGRRTKGSESIGVGIGSCFRDRLKPQQMQGLHGPALHGGYTQRSLFAVLLGDIDTP